ncbi:MAG: isoprenyl transferase [Proteobacteria bacterium]|nr:isoprenyl transferase [Pseudomonadota bacterium]
MSKKEQSDRVRNCLKLLGKEGLPRHIAIIMDGNGRWAQQRKKPRVFGHRAGVESVRELVRASGEMGIEVLTLFAFSSENWRRPEKEVSLLMELFLMALEKEVRKLDTNNVQLRIIGDVADFPEKIRIRIAEAESLTLNNTGLVLNIAANYGGKWDICQAVRQLATRVKQGELEPDEITEEKIAERLKLHDLPEPDLFIRTGGEQRISNFLVWQLAYTELFFTPVLWPDFNRDEFEKALISFSHRQRRFGQTGKQVEQRRNA